jgi:hypothetical protein
MQKIRNKDDLINHYSKCLKYMVSDLDFQRYLGAGAAEKTIKYGDIKDVPSILDLLPEEKDYRIILTEWKKNMGHWCCLLRYGNTIEWFDSFGILPDGELKFVPKFLRKALGEQEHALTRILKKAKEDGFLVIYNKRRFQSQKPGVDTCGRWALSRVVSMLLGYDLEDYQQMIDKRVKETGKPADIVVCDLIPLPMGE